MSPSPQPLGNPLFDALRAGFAANVNNVAVETDQGLNYTWSDLERGSAMMANLLEKWHLPPGARLIAQVDKSVEVLMLYLATLRAGWVFIPMNTAYTSDEMAYFIDNAKPDIVVCTPHHFSVLSQIAFRAQVRQVLTLSDDRRGSLLDRAMHCSERHQPVARRPEDLAVILYTSGTTGRSKGAMLSHGNLLSNALTLQQVWDFRTDDVLLHVLPIFHIHGLLVAIHAALLNGSPMLWVGKFTPEAVIAKLPRATVLMGVPTMYGRLLQSPALTRASCARMRVFISGSAPLRVDTFEAWQQRTGHTLLERYGMSETAMLCSNPCRPQEGPRKGGTVGRALPGVEVRVVNPAGHALPPGSIGDIQVRGPNVFQGYWHMPEQTAEAFTAEGWFQTGDVGYFDDEAYLHMVGRSKDLIITGGYNVYPAEVETCLNALPGVQDSAVIGVPHPDWGEGVIAVVVPQPNMPPPNPKDLVHSLKAHLARYKVPKRILLAADLPRNAMGKVQKNRLRQQHARCFETSSASS